MKSNEQLYEELGYTLQHSSQGIYFVIAPDHMQDTIANTFPKYPVYDYKKPYRDTYSFNALSEWILNNNSNSFFILNFQILFYLEERKKENIVRVNFSRDMMSRLNKNIFLFMTQTAADILNRHAIDFYSFVKKTFLFEDEQPIPLPICQTKQVDIPTPSINIDYTGKTKEELLIRAMSEMRSGDYYMEIAEYEDALKSYLTAVDIREKILGDADLDTGYSYDRTGIIYSHMAYYAKALEYHEKSLAIREKVLGQDHPDTAASYNNIGNVYYDMGDYGKALEYHEKSLAIKEKVLGQDHPDTAMSYNNIGNVYSRMGDYGKALEYHEKSLAIKEKVLGQDHPDTAMCYNNIGLAYYDMGDYGKALEYHGKSLAIKEKVLGQDHPDTAMCYNNIGIAYYDMGDYGKALEYHEKSLAIKEKVLGQDHPSTKKSRKQLEDMKEYMLKSQNVQLLDNDWNN